jgi:uncharacterized protein YbcI
MARESRLSDKREHTIDGLRDAGEPPPDAHLNHALANEVVRCYRRRAGRGPTQARAFHRAGVVVVVLEGVLTPVERSLVAGGRQAAVREHRAAVRDTMGVELAGAIHALTGCRVQAALSANDVDRDLAAEVFVLETPLPEHACA